MTELHFCIYGRIIPYLFATNAIIISLMQLSIFFNHIEKRFNIILCVRWSVFIAHIALKSFAKAFYLKQHVRICATNLGDEDVYYSDSDGDDDSAISNPRDE